MTQVGVGIVVWVVLLIITVLMTSTAHFAEWWHSDWGFWVWCLGWLAVSIFIVWLTDE